MDSYVIRIYRRDDNDPANIAGQVEFVEREETCSFGCARELMKILTCAKQGKPIPNEAAQKESKPRQRDGE